MPQGSESVKHLRRGSPWSGRRSGPRPRPCFEASWADDLGGSLGVGRSGGLPPRRPRRGAWPSRPRRGPLGEFPGGPASRWRRVAGSSFSAVAGGKEFLVLARQDQAGSGRGRRWRSVPTPRRSTTAGPVPLHPATGGWRQAVLAIAGDRLVGQPKLEVGGEGSRPRDVAGLGLRRHRLQWQTASSGGGCPLESSGEEGSRRPRPARSQRRGRRKGFARQDGRRASRPGTIDVASRSERIEPPPRPRRRGSYTCRRPRAPRRRWSASSR